MRIEIRDLELPMQIGVLPDERGRFQMVVVTAIVTFMPSSDQDNLTAVIDTRLIRARLQKLMASRHYDLQETFVRAAIQLLMNLDDRVSGVDVSLAKPSAYPDCTVVVSESASRHAPYVI